MKVYTLEVCIDAWEDEEGNQLYKLVGVYNSKYEAEFDWKYQYKNQYDYHFVGEWSV